MPSAQSSSRNENFVSTSKNLLKKQKFNFSGSAQFHMKTRVCLKYFVNDCSLFEINTYSKRSSSTIALKKCASVFTFIIFKTE